MAEWFYTQNGQQAGPVGDEVLRNMAASGQLQPADMVWKDGMASWMTAGSVKELFPTICAPPTDVAPIVDAVSLTGHAQTSTATSVAAPFQVIGYYTPGLWANSQRHQLTELSSGLVVLLHLITGGLFSTIWFGMMHGKMPVNRHDDPSAGKAIGFMFIPLFNIYWMFFMYGRLCTRINEQRVMRGLAPTAPKGLLIAALILMLTGCGSPIGAFILMPIFVCLTQSSVNELISASGRTT